MGAPGPDHFDRNALLERIELRLEIARQGRCQVTLECIRRCQDSRTQKLYFRMRLTALELRTIRRHMCGVTHRIEHIVATMSRH
mmetsp:Transcript_1340/g.4160  ORF Transcript_1340/g.4160 Transcript_1340/m.4160 type:complete len:84 (+) Transcript_1340:81-332(+)